MVQKSCFLLFLPRPSLFVALLRLGEKKKLIYSLQRRVKVSPFFGLLLLLLSPFFGYDGKGANIITYTFATRKCRLFTKVKLDGGKKGIKYIVAFARKKGKGEKVSFCASAIL